MPETFLNKAQLTGLSADARRTEILRAKDSAALDVRLTAIGERLAAIGAQTYYDVASSSLTLRVAPAQIAGIDHTVTMPGDGYAVIQYSAHINVTTHAGNGVNDVWLRTILNGAAYVDWNASNRYVTFRSSANGQAATVASQLRVPLDAGDTFRIRLFGSCNSDSSDAQAVLGHTNVLTTVILT